MAMVPLPRSWPDFDKASKELAMDLGKGTMASNTGFSNLECLGLNLGDFYLIQPLPHVNQTNGTNKNSAFGKISITLNMELKLFHSFSQSLKALNA